jgi:diguanylate cyclase (GGDEF)-like protein
VAKHESTFEQSCRLDVGRALVLTGAIAVCAVVAAYALSVHHENHFGPLPAVVVTVGLVVVLLWSAFSDLDRSRRHVKHQENYFRALVKRLAQKIVALEAEQLQQKLHHQALHDSLTGLPNRTLICDRLGSLLLENATDRTGASLLSIDLDNFRDVNDSLGFEAGDELLRSVAERLARTVRPSDTLGRLGGDEFLVLTEDGADRESAELMAERILAVLSGPFMIDRLGSTPLLIGASIGIATLGGETAEELIRNAEVALHQAKSEGKARYTVFKPSMHDTARRRLQLELELADAVELRQFFLEYQPVLALDRLDVVGVEALLRWRHPTRGVISPAEFVPMLEESGAIVEVGHWVLREACTQAAIWQARGFDLSVSVNVAAQQLDSGNLVEHVSDALAISLLDPSHLIVEITENNLMKDASCTVDRLLQLKRLGVRIALDDFGTGYSSMGYLQRFPIDILKIDRASCPELLPRTRSSGTSCGSVTTSGSKWWRKGSKNPSSCSACAPSTATSARGTSSPGPWAPKLSRRPSRTEEHRGSENA